MLLETLQNDMKTAMKARDKVRLDAVRLLISALKYILVDKKDLTEQDEIAFLASEAKKRRESIEAYEKAQREDLASKERAELAVIEGYLPQQLGPDEVREIVRAAIAETGAASKKDFAKVMKVIMPKLQGRFPGKDVRPLVDEQLP